MSQAIDAEPHASRTAATAQSIGVAGVRISVSGNGERCARTTAPTVRRGIISRHDQARSRAYRWGEDGIAGFSDDRQLLCLSIALWNGRDPILKERLFGLTNAKAITARTSRSSITISTRCPATPTRACSTSCRKRPIPIEWLIQENARRRGSTAMEFELIDTGIFNDDRYFDVEIEYAKADADDVLMRTTVHNRGPEPASDPHPAASLVPEYLELVGWGEKTIVEGAGRRPGARAARGAGHLRIEFEAADRLLFCENETNFARAVRRQLRPRPLQGCVPRLRHPRPHRRR